MVSPLAYRDSTTSSTSFSRRCRFLTMTGSNEPSRSRGTSMVTGPTPSVVTVLTVVLLRVFALRPRAFLVLRASGMLGHLLVQGGLRHGPGELPERAVRPGRVEPRSFARLIISNASSRSAAHAPNSSRFPGFAAAPLPAAGFVVMISIVSVGMLITGPFPTGPATGDQDQLHTSRDSPCKSAF